jgi:antitoxin component of MazEF toxin-antitoxin module
MKDVRVQVREVDDSAGIILPPDVMAELGVGIGDTLRLVRTERGYLLTPEDESGAMEGFEIIRQKHRAAFRELAE